MMRQEWNLSLDDIKLVGLFYLSYSICVNLFYSLDGSREFFCTKK